MLDVKGPGARKNLHPWFTLDKFPHFQVNLKCFYLSGHGFPPPISICTVHSLRPRGVIRVTPASFSLKDVRLNIGDCQRVRVVGQVRLKVGGKCRRQAGGNLNCQGAPVVLKKGEMHQMGALHSNGRVERAIRDTDISDRRRGLTPRMGSREGKIGHGEETRQKTCHPVPFGKGMGTVKCRPIFPIARLCTGRVTRLDWRHRRKGQRHCHRVMIGIGD